MQALLGLYPYAPLHILLLDPHLPLGPDELSIDVERLNVDAASFRQLAQEAKGDAQRISTRVAEIVRARGKMHNPVTGSGGMLIGRVAEVGPEHPAAAELKAGDRIATLVSLTLTPLVLQEIERVQPRAERLDVRGRAILFATGLWARLPEDDFISALRDFASRRLREGDSVSLRPLPHRTGPHRGDRFGR